MASHDGRQRAVAELRAELTDWFRTYSEPANNGAGLPVTGYGQLAPPSMPDTQVFAQPVKGSRS